MHQISVKSIVFALIAGISSLFGGWDYTMTILVFLMFFDYLTGFIAAFLCRELSSKIGSRGILKKISILIMVVIAHLLDLAVGSSLPMFRNCCAYFYIGNEGLSVLENAVKIGIPVPALLKNGLKELTDESLDKK
ncbi:MAG TPA: hypothetical protein DHN33_03740 [Eubacteriaceae bacterium]|nr:hypothetical protein [Eubacteriaceae bacterium]